MPADPSRYTSDWPNISYGLKLAAGWRCQVCGHKHEVESGYVLTVHHLDMDPLNNDPRNLLVCCQRCHLQVQAAGITRDTIFLPGFKPAWIDEILEIPADIEFNYRLGWPRPINKNIQGS